MKRELRRCIWKLGFRDQGFGHGDYGVITARTQEVVISHISKKLAEHIIKLHNADLKLKNDKKETYPIPHRNKTTLYTVQRCRKNDDVYGSLHGSDNACTTTCGAIITENWWITNVTSDGEVTCKKCIKLIAEK